MQKIIGLFLFALSLVAFNALTAKAQDVPANGTDIIGYCRIAGKAPAAFRRDEIEIHLAGTDRNQQYLGQVVAGKPKAIEYKFNKLTGTGKNISFTTRAVRGVSYKFEGAFTRLDFQTVNASGDEIVLKGKLTKLKNGKAVTTANVGFTFFPGE